MHNNYDKSLAASSSRQFSNKIVTHTNSKLQLIVAFNQRALIRLIVDFIQVSQGARQVAPATICNHTFKLINALASEGALSAPIFENAFIYANEEGVWAQATSFLTSKLIVVYSKASLHFHKDRGIFCEGEKEQKQQHAHYPGANEKW